MDLKTTSHRKLAILLIAGLAVLAVSYLTGGEYAATARHFLRHLFRYLF